ncbi:MAG: DUF488 domain-containing protein [Candidatus Marsarchaeota archaeon]|nr:DUF488 domain-containing protein [Candidatus Marsarchaeota archaeon]
MRKKPVMFTIGYSNRNISNFIAMLKTNGVEMLVDIRTIPKSRHQPDFNEKMLAYRLGRNRIKYYHFAELGGLRKPLKDSINTAWRNESFKGYADYMQTTGFASAIKKLARIGKAHKLALMCAEGNPFRCHRSLVADALTVKGWQVFEISGKKTLREHALTGFARVKGTKVVYDGKNG